MQHAWGCAARAAAVAGASWPLRALPSCQTRGCLCSLVPSTPPTPAQALTRADIEPALAQLKKKLMERNVAEEIADK